MSRAERGFTAREFTVACQNHTTGTLSWRFNDWDSREVLKRFCELGLLVQDGARYFATPALHAALDTDPELPRRT